MQKKKITTLIVLLLAFSVLGPGLEDSKEHRMEINVSSQVDKDFQNYPIKLEIPGDELQDQANNAGYDIDENCDVFGSNVAFINLDEDREYDFWVEEGDCDEEFTAWVDIPFLQAQNNQDQDLTFYMYSGEEMENTNNRREVFQFFEDFQTYAIGQPISNYREWNIETLSGEEEEFGEADITTNNELSLESGDGKTTITHPIGAAQEEDLTLDIKSTLNEGQGTTIGLTDGRANRSGEMIAGYQSSIDTSQTEIKKRQEPNLEEVDEITETDSTSISTGETYIQTLVWNENTLRYAKDDQDYEEMDISSAYRYDQRPFLQISANQDTQANIEWVRLRHRAENPPEINNGDGIQDTDIEDVNTQEPEVDEQYPENGETIEGFSRVRLEVEANYDYYDESDLTAIFRSPELGTIGYDTISDSSDSATAIWPDLRHGEEYEWYVELCDQHLNCTENPQSNSHTFEIDHEDPEQDLRDDDIDREDLFMGLRDDDYQPQGFYSEESEELGDEQPDEVIYRRMPSQNENWVVTTRTISEQLEPGMETTSYGLASEVSNPDSIARFIDYIDYTDELGESHSSHPLWFDTLTTSDRADRYAMAPDRNWAVDSTGTPYPSGEYSGGQAAYVKTELIQETSEGGLGMDRDNLIRNDWTDESVPKASRAMSNSVALTASSSEALMDESGGFIDGRLGMPGTSAQLIKGPIHEDRGDTSSTKLSEGMGFWMDPDDLRIYNPIYNDTYDNQLHGTGYNQPIYEEDMINIITESHVLDITGPSSGLGYYLPEFSGEDEFEFYSTAGTAVILGDVYWEGEYMSDVDDPNQNDAVSEELNPFMCGDDQNEYLLEELGEINNSQPEEGNFACVSHNDACVSWSAGENHDGRKVFGIGEYADTDSPDEYMGPTKNSEELCMRYDFEYPRFDSAGIDTDILPAWYPQDLSPEVCRENTLMSSTQGVRWIEKSMIEEQPYAFKGGINNDLNPYLYETKELENEIDFYNYDEDMISNNPDNLNLDLDPGDSIPISTGRSEDPDVYEFNGHKTVTAGFCGGDDDGEYFQHQDCHADFCPTSTDTFGVANSPEKCILETDYDMFENEIAGFEGFDNYKGEDQGSTGNDQRRQYEQGENVTIQTTAGPEPITCFGGTWYEDDQWPLLDDIEDQTINLGETLGIQFEILNPTENVEEFEISYTAGSDISPFTEFLSTDETEYTIEVEPETIETETMVVEGERTIDPTDDNEIELQVESTSLEELDSTAFEVEVVEHEEAVASERTEATELPGPSTPLTIIAMIVTSMFYIFKRQEQ